MGEELVNKVAASGLVQLDLESYLPEKPVVGFDLRPFLFMELILREKDFRQALKELDWSVYRDKIVAVHCSADAIIPMWAYMLVAACLQPMAADIIFGNEQEATRQWVVRRLHQLDPASFAGQRVVVKGCGDRPVGAYAFLEIAKILTPHVRSLMYGEPCSTVPVYKRKEGNPAVHPETQST